MNMTQVDRSVDRIAEFNALFLNLNEKGQEAALTVLRSLEFAQSVMDPHEDGQLKKPLVKTT